MMLCYGNGETYKLDQNKLSWVRAKATKTIKEREVALAVREAIANPIDYPNLASATVPGDTVAIALQYETPQVLSVLEGLLWALKQAGVEKSSITLLLAAEFSEDAAMQQAIRDLAGGDVAVVVHDAGIEEQMALLGVTEANRMLRLNRILCDADLVIPAGPLHLDSSAIGLSGRLFPEFSDEQTRNRFHAPAAHETLQARQKLVAESRECDWMLGVGLALQVVPGPDGSVAKIYCGTPDGITQAANTAYHDTWDTEVAGQVDLVIATIVGNGAQQTWHNLSRALIAAEEMLAPGGAIAICSEIAARPGPSGRRLRDAADLADVERKLMKDEFRDSLAALQLCRSLQRGTVYLKSHLAPEVVERLGFAPIASNQEIDRLVQTYERCTVLEEAQYLLPTLTISQESRAARSAAQ
jgi:nickel-dependent lactate racemase